MTLVSCTLPENTYNRKCHSYADDIIKTFLQMNVSCAEITESGKTVGALGCAIARSAKNNQAPVKFASRSGKAYLVRTTKTAMV